VREGAAARSIILAQEAGQQVEHDLKVEESNDKMETGREGGEEPQEVDQIDAWKEECEELKNTVELLQMSSISLSGEERVEADMKINAAEARIDELSARFKTPKLKLPAFGTKMGSGATYVEPFIANMSLEGGSADVSVIDEVQTRKTTVLEEAEEKKSRIEVQIDLVKKDIDALMVKAFQLPPGEEKDSIKREIDESEVLNPTFYHVNQR